MADKITMDSKLKDLFATPIGHDIIHKILLQIGKDDSFVSNPLTGNMKLKSVAKLIGKMLDENFFETFLNLVNSETDRPLKSTAPIREAWWKEAVFYQIYPRTFCDSNDDGIGDIPGIISKLDYLKDLGITALWLSPIYDSPMDDNGYDIRDYRKILKDFGTMEDFDQLLKEVHDRDMKLIMDLVVNHTSDEHEWFQKALDDPSSEYRDYYFLKDDTGSIPNNWTSFFAGSAWNHYEDKKLWGLHLFSKKQMDLNWDNPKVRENIIDMINWWLDKGVDGFRMDVINYISKQPGLPQGNESVGSLMGYCGIEHYFYGPHLHEYLREIHEKAFAPHNSFSVGETPGLGMHMSQLITGEERKELDMIFSFDHLEAPGHTRFEDYAYDLNYLRDYMTEWMEDYGNNCWMSLFFNNHDNPKMISKISTDPAFRKPLAKLLAVLQFTLKGTPFVYQGDEMGLVNYPFRSIDDLNDVESKGYYEQISREKGEAEAWKTVYAGTRDHARVPLPWNKIDKDYLKQPADEEITAVYKELIALRKNSHALVYGDFETKNTKKGRFTYTRSDGKDTYLIDCNLSDKKVSAYPVSNSAKLLFPSHLNNVGAMDPYEARIWKL